jgi:hypothetical protein
MDMKFVNGTRAPAMALHVGLCLTDDRRAAKHYGETLTDVELDLSGLVVEDVETYDHETNTAAADDDCAAYSARGVDVIRYEDETERSYRHTTWRLVSARAVAAVRVASSAGEVRWEVHGGRVCQVASTRRGLLASVSLENSVAARGLRRRAHRWLRCEPSFARACRHEPQRTPRAGVPVEVTACGPRVGAYAAGAS